MSPVVVGYYGKLPLSPEFFRLHAVGSELRWLDDWLQRGMLYAKAVEGPRWPTLIAESDLWNFIYVPAGQGRIVCGVIMASQDKAGRSFPFLTFLLLERGSLLNKFWLVPVMAGEFLEEVTKLLQGLRKGLDWDQFHCTLEAVGGIRINVESHAKEFVQYLRTTKAKGWWARLCGAIDNSETYQNVQSFGSLIRLFKESVNGQIPWGIKFPLFSPAAPERYDVAFWLTASTRTVSQGQQHEPGMLAFWSRSPTKVRPCLLISCGPGSPNLARFIVTPEVQDDSWRDAVSLPQTAVGTAGPIGNEANPVLGDPAISLEEVLEYFSSSDRI